MSEQTYEDDGNENESSVMRKLRADADAGRKASAELEELRKQNQQIIADQQELAMRRAQIDPESPLAQMFRKANPDLVDVDTLKSEWQKIAGATAPRPDQGAMQRIAGASAGGESAGGAGFDPHAAFDSIPLITDGQYNPNYQNEVLRVAQQAAAAEGRPFEVSGGQIGWQEGAHGPGPATSPI